MIVPFGPSKPNYEEKRLLSRIGFDLDKHMSESNGFYYLEIPKNLKVESRRLSDTQKVMSISLDGIHVISIDTKMSLRTYRMLANFELNEKNINQHFPANNNPKAEVSMKACL